MSRTRKANDYIKRNQWTNIHHCINKSCGGRDVSENRMEIQIKTHKAIHELFGNKLPHEIIEIVLETVCKPFIEELKRELYQVLEKYKWKEYKTHTYHWRYPNKWPFSWLLKSDGES